MSSNLLGIIHPRFGSVSICDCSLGDSASEGMLVKYDKDRAPKRDRNGNLSANLIIRHQYFMGAFVRVSFGGDEKVNRVLAVVSIRESDERLQTAISPLIDFMTREGFFETVTDPANNQFLYRNALNELSIQIFDEQIMLDLHYPDASVTSHSSAYEEGAARTLDLINSNADDPWYGILIHRSATSFILKEPVASTLVELPEGAESDKDATTLWKKYVEVFTDKPRMAAIIELATVFHDNDSDTYFVEIPVAVEAQKSWLEEKMVGTLTQGFSEVTGGRKVKIAIEVKG